MQRGEIDVGYKDGTQSQVTLRLIPEFCCILTLFFLVISMAYIKYIIGGKMVKINSYFGGSDAFTLF